MKIILLLLLFIVFISSTEAQTAQPTPVSTANKSRSVFPALSPEQIAALKEVNEINVKTVKLFSERNFKESLTLAEQAAEKAESAGLFEKGRVIHSLNNLAEIYLNLKREADAIAAFEKAALLYEKYEGEKSENLIKILGRLAYSYTLKKNFAKAEQNHLRLIELRRQSLNGAENSESVNLVSNLADFYAYAGNRAKAETFYKQAVEISDRVFKPDQEKFDDAVNRYQCYLFQQKGYEESSKYLKLFNQTRAGNYLPEDSVKVASGNVINGKAKKLITPPYPPEAKQVRASGVVLIKVEIDETGKVISAKSTCGYDVLAKVSESAALKSSFTPTVKDGVPVKVTGIIVYKFVAQ